MLGVAANALDWSRSRVMSLQCHHALCSQRLQVWFKVETNLSLDSTMSIISLETCHSKQCLIISLETSAQLRGHFRTRTRNTQLGAFQSIPRIEVPQAGCPTFWFWGVRPSEPLAKASQQSQKPRKPFQSMSPQSQNPRHTACHTLTPTEVKCHKLCVPRSGSEVSQKVWGGHRPEERPNPQVYPNGFHRIDWNVTSWVNESRNQWNQWVSLVSGSLIEMRLGSWIIHNIIENWFKFSST